MNDPVMLSQPPPDAPPPPPGPEVMRSHRRMRWIVWGGGGCAVVLILWLLTAPSILKSAPASPRTEVISNIKEIGLALQDFDAEYNQFPDASTAAAVKAASHTPLTLGGGSSNQIFRQLLANGLKSELPFYAKIAGSKRPDNRFDDDAHALAKGECGFAYIAGLSSSNDPSTPVLVTPLIPGTTTFDPKPFGGQAIILRLDNSANGYPIDPSGHVTVNGMDLFDSRQPFWHGKAPDLRLPE
ncbi:MAG: hypothetical protein JWO82_3292 [Akkermansiaceae bacterium]|nr:hypothetical protein [Akkermansiaceae bacterium]